MTDAAKSEKKLDLQRPLYDRRVGDVSILLDIIDAVPVNANQVGSRQYFLVDLSERFARLLQKSDLLKLRRYFRKRQLLEETCIEAFTDNCLCILCPGSPHALSQLHCQWQAGELQRHFADCFVTPVALKKLNLRSLNLRVKSWPDEFDRAEKEWRSGQMPCEFDMSANERSRQMLLQVRRFQLKRLQNPVTGALPRLRELEAKYETNLTSIINYLKMLLGASLTCVESQKVLAELRSSRPELARCPDARHLDDYLAALKHVATATDSLDTGVAEPLAQLRVGGETPGQVAKRCEAFALVVEMRTLLEETASLTRLRHDGIFARVSASERSKLGGLLSLLPCLVRLLADFDEALDAYFNSGSVHFRPAELAVVN